MPYYQLTKEHITVTAAKYAHVNNSRHQRNTEIRFHLDSVIGSDKCDKTRSVFYIVISEQIEMAVDICSDDDCACFHFSYNSCILLLEKAAWPEYTSRFSRPYIHACSFLSVAFPTLFWMNWLQTTLVFTQHSSVVYLPTQSQCTLIRIMEKLNYWTVILTFWIYVS
jgi:hypothetical protein